MNNSNIFSSTTLYNSQNENNTNKSQSNNSTKLKNEEKNRKKKYKQSSGFIKNILVKVKENLIDDEIKKEFFLPVYNQIYLKILPHYLTFLILLSIIIILQLTIIYIIINIKYSSSKF